MPIWLDSTDKIKKHFINTIRDRSKVSIYCCLMKSTVKIGHPVNQDILDRSTEIRVISKI